MSILGKKILAGLVEARDFTKGKNLGQRIHHIPIPEQVDVKAIRANLQMTQNEVADTFGFTVASVRNWEQGKRTPEGPARILLTIIAREPTTVL